MALSKVERAHRMYREGAYEEALLCYSDALAFAKTIPQKIALHSNRAACFLKLLLFQKAADECTSVLELDINHTGALMLRAQTLVTLKEYQSALFDVNRLLELNPSSDVYQNLQSRLKTQLSLAPIPEAETELEETDEDPVKVFSEGDDKTTGRAKEETGTTSSSTRESHDRRPGSDPDSNGWQVIPKPRGHSRLDYSHWDSVNDCSDDDDNDDDGDDNRPQFRFRVKTVDIRTIK